MSLRPADALAYATFKAGLVESNQEAFFSDGRKQPAYYRVRNGQVEWFVEINYQWLNHTEAVKYGLVRYERIPDPQPPIVETPPAESTKLQGHTTTELVQDAEAKTRRAVNEQYANRQNQNSYPASNSAFAEAAHRERQIIAAQKGRRNY